MNRDSVVEPGVEAVVEPHAEPEAPVGPDDETLPLCACGCGRRVKAAGRKLHSRACVGRYSALLREESNGAVPEADLIEQAKRLAREIPLEARSEFFQKVVELVNAEEELRDLLERSIET